MKKKLPKQKRDKTSLFPKIYRFITESWKLIVFSLISGLIVIAIVLQSYSLYSNLQEEEKIKQERGGVEKELAFWKNSLTKYKDSRDIYFKIATLEYRLGNVEEARSSLSKALEIDPNFEKGRAMKEQLEL